MADMAFDAIGQYSKVLKLGFSAAEFANLAQEMDLPRETVETIASVLRRISEKKTETAEETRETGFLQDAGAFLSDMWDFLLASLPYLAVLAVPALVALIFRRRKKRG